MTHKRASMAINRFPYNVPERVAILARDIVTYKSRSLRVVVSNVNGN